MVMFALFFFSSFLSVFAQSLEVSYVFDRPVVETDALGYSELLFPNAPNINCETFPLLPWYPAKLLLPEYTEIENVEIISLNYGKITQQIILKPGGKELPLMEPQSETAEPKMADQVYNLAGPYPSETINNVKTQFLCGHSIGTFNICPVRTYPAEKRVEYLQEIKLIIHCKSAKNTVSLRNMLRKSPLIESRIRSLVPNPEMINSYRYSTAGELIENDLLIITSEDLRGTFSEYANYKRSTGYLVKLVNVEDIYNSYSGCDNPEKIRNYIINQFQSFGTSWVILAGDSHPEDPDEDIIPHRGLYVDDGIYTDYDIAADMYYACLDGTWNTNDNNKWGEVGEYDAFAEVAVGRLSVDNTEEATGLIEKLISYQNYPVKADIEKAMMLGEFLNAGTYGGDYKDEVANGSGANGFYTAGFPENFALKDYYDRDIDWDEFDIFEVFNTSGTGIINHLGHANITSNMKIGNSQVNLTNFQNDGMSRGFVVGYSQGCYSGSFDNRQENGLYNSSDCFAEKITNLANGEVAMIANSRYGFYVTGGTNSSSQYLDRQFFDALFGEDIGQIGNALNDSKDDNANYMSSWEKMRYNIYGCNLFGDPSMYVWTQYPEDIIVSYPPSVPLGISEISFNTNAPGARIGLIQNNTIIGRGITDGSGNLILNLFSPLLLMDDISLSIIAHNRNRYTDIISVTEDGPYVVYDHHTFTEIAGNNNGQPDYGESLYLDLGLKNIGSEPTDNIQVNITISDFTQIIDLIDNQEYYGDFEAGEVKFINNGFAFQVSDYVSDQHNFRFIIKAEGETTWSSFISTIINAPELVPLNISYHDYLTGNGNNIPDPGETGQIVVFAKNTGHASSGETSVSINTSYPYITLLNETVNVGIIAPGAKTPAQFIVKVNDWVPVQGDFAAIFCTVASEPYSGDSVFQLKIGEVVEDFETGDFTKFNWINTGEEAWIISSTAPYEGSFCAASGNISYEESSGLEINIDVQKPDSISFFYKLEVETFASLAFYVDGVLEGKWSGNKSWKKYQEYVPVGLHNFKWVFINDSLNQGGENRAYLDYINLPMSDDFFTGEFPQQAFITEKPDIIFYPNPASNYVNIRPLNLDNTAYEIHILDFSGNEVYSSKQGKSSEHLNSFIWTNNDTKTGSGIYFVYLIADHFSLVKKLAIIK